MLSRWFCRVVLARRWLTFLVLALSFLAFGAGTLNLILVLRANLELIADFGMMALADGAALQLLDIVLTAAVSMAAYIVFKACEYRLVHDLTDPGPAAPIPVNDREPPP